MPKYAQHDHTLTKPHQVIGWYDTDEFDYPNLPPQADLIALTDTQWDNRHSTPFTDGVTLIPKPAPSKADTAAAAKATANAAIQAQIVALESTQGRAIREAAIGMAGAVDRLKALDASIAALRVKLQP